MYTTAKNKMALKGQSTLELTAAMILLLMLLVGAVKIFVWVNERIVHRQVDYENTRVQATRVGRTEVEVDESAYPKLDIVGSLD